MILECFVLYLSLPLDPSPNTHHQVRPHRGGEVSHRGTGVFCWMHRLLWAYSASSCMSVSSLCNRNPSAVWIIWVVHVSPILYIIMHAWRVHSRWEWCTCMYLHNVIDTQCDVYIYSWDVNFLFLCHNLLLLFQQSRYYYYTYAVFLHTKSMAATLRRPTNQWEVWSLYGLQTVAWKMGGRITFFSQILSQFDVEVILSVVRGSLHTGQISHLLLYPTLDYYSLDWV